MKNSIVRFVDRDEFLTPFDKLFDKLMFQSFPDFSKEVGADFFHTGSYPKIDAIEYPDRVEIEAEIPGLKKEDLSIKVENDVLSICGNKREAVENKNGKHIIKELKRSSFKRSFNLHDGLDKSNIEAKFNEGILTIVLQKLTKEQATGIEVKIE